MKIKVRDRVYDGEDEPVMVILNEEDKYNIAHMSADNMKYCSYPATGKDPEEIRRWMADVPEV